MAAVEMYTAGFCPFCYRAKALLEQKNVAYKEIRIDGDPQLRQQMMSRANGRHTVPQIFINDRHIGGCDDIMALESSGQLDSMLAN